MNSVKFQDTKSTYKTQLHVCTVRMNYLKKKLRKISHNSIKKNKIHKNKFNQGDKRSVH